MISKRRLKKRINTYPSWFTSKKSKKLMNLLGIGDPKPIDSKEELNVHLYLRKLGISLKSTKGFQKILRLKYKPRNRKGFLDGSRYNK